MTQPTHDEVIAWIDERIAYIDDIDGNDDELHLIASLLANRDVLERHQGTEVFFAGLDSHCKECGFNLNTSIPGAAQIVMTNFPCSTYLDIYNRIREVM